MKGLELRGMQDLQGDTRVKGVTRVCHNLHECGDGSLGVVMPDKVLGVIDFAPVACDRVGSSTAIFAQEDDGTLLEVCRVDDSGEVEYRYKALARIEERVKQGASVGNFLVLRGEAGTLMYVYRKEGEYEWLGGLPGAPEFQAEAGDVRSFEGGVVPVAFRTVSSDLRGGLDAESERRVGEALLSGMAEAVDAARRAGYRVMPVMVRVAWRLWDGNLLHVSEPQLVSSGVDWPGRERVLLSLTRNDKGYTGVDGGSVSVNAYRLRIIASGGMPEGWGELLKGVEVWVSREPNCLREGESPRVAQNLTNLNQLTCSLAARKEEDVLREVRDLPMSVQLVRPDWNGPMWVPVDASAEENGVMTGQSEPAAAVSQMPDKADSILGYGDFLHVCSGRSVRTSRRGNPWVMAGYTESAGDEVTHMWPQLSGGGAYTRQYIYIATRRGIAAVMHDAGGVHKNCRYIAPLVVEEGCMAVPTPEGLIAVGATGEVMRLQDARSKTLLRRVDGVKSVVRCASRGWIALMGKSKALVLQEDADMRGFTRSFVYHGLEGCYWRGLGWHEMRAGEVYLYDTETASEGVPPTDMLYRGALESPGGCGGRRMRRVWVALRGKSVMALVHVRAGGREQQESLARIGVSGRVNEGVRVAVSASAAVCGKRLDYELVVSGSFERLADAMWLPPVGLSVNKI